MLVISTNHPVLCTVAKEELFENPSQKMTNTDDTWMKGLPNDKQIDFLVFTDIFPRYAPVRFPSPSGTCAKGTGKHQAAKADTANSLPAWDDGDFVWTKNIRKPYIYHDFSAKTSENTWICNDYP